MKSPFLLLIVVNIKIFATELSSEDIKTLIAQEVDKKIVQYSPSLLTTIVSKLLDPRFLLPATFVGTNIYLYKKYVVTRKKAKDALKKNRADFDKYLEKEKSELKHQVGQVKGTLVSLQDKLDETDQLIKQNHQEMIASNQSFLAKMQELTNQELTNLTFNINKKLNETENERKDYFISRFNNLKQQMTEIEQNQSRLNIFNEKAARDAAKNAEDFDQLMQQLERSSSPLLKYRSSNQIDSNTVDFDG
jgi:hypothetical protein